jgi:hypothetical protein
LSETRAEAVKTCEIEAASLVAGRAAALIPHPDPNVGEEEVVEEAEEAAVEVAVEVAPLFLALVNRGKQLKSSLCAR